MLLQQSIEHVSIVYTCITYFVMRWSMLLIREYLVNVRIQYTLLRHAEELIQKILHQLKTDYNYRNKHCVIFVILRIEVHIKVELLIAIYFIGYRWDVDITI